MELYRKEIFRLDGKDFSSLKAAQQHVKEQIGAILDQTPLRSDPKQAIAVFDAIIANRARLVDLLTVEVEPEDGEFQSPAKNLLDYKL